MPFDGAYPITPGQHFREGHQAYDHMTPSGTPLLAMSQGVVVYAGWDDRFPVGARDGRGIYVDVDHGGGWLSRLLHLSEVVVAVGQVVSQGELLGFSGTTGLSTGPHVHTCVFRDELPVDWLQVLGAFL